MTTYLVDYENTSATALAGYSKLTPDDTVVIFIGAKNGTSGIPVDTVIKLTAPGPKPRLLWKRSKKTAKNYLDFQLASYLGSLIGDPAIEECEYVIISKDHGFEACVDFWAERRRDVRISLKPQIAAEALPRPVSAGDTPVQASPSATIGEVARKKVRIAVRPLGLKPSAYTVIYRELAAASDVASLRTRLDKALPGRGAEIFASLRQANIVPSSR